LVPHRRDDQGGHRKEIIGMAQSIERVDHTIPKEEAVFAFGPDPGCH